MSEQAAAGWYPDGQGDERFWDGSSWTDHVRAPQGTEMTTGGGGAIPERSGALSRMGAAVKKAAADRAGAKEALKQKQEQDAAAAGPLLTSGVFGTSTIEVYQGGYVRVAFWPEGVSLAAPAPISKETPYEKLRSIKYTPPSQEQSSSGASALEGTVGPAVASLIKGGSGLFKASAPGLAVAGMAHVVSANARVAHLTITTDQRVHSLTNKTGKRLIGATNRGHNDVGLALEEVGLALLGLDTSTSSNQGAAPQPGAVSHAKADPTLAERMRELAELHRDGILSDDEFATVKARLLSGL